MTNSCFPCGLNALDPSTLPQRERVYDDGLWRVAHAFNSALPGWMVVIARRHITSLAQMTREEADALGPLLRGLSGALEHVCDVPKAYVFFMAEAEGFAHLHIHVVPRPRDLPHELRGPRIFAYLDHPEAEWVGLTEMDRITAQIGGLLKDS